MGIDKTRFGAQAFPEQIETQYDQNGVGEKYIAMRQSDPEVETVHPSALFIQSRLKDPADKSLVDVGCGGGQDFADYLKLGFVDARGVEPSKVMADAARKLVGDETLIVSGTWTKLPFPDASKDYIVGRASLHYEEDIDAAYREVARVLKPGGTLVIVVAHPTKAKDRQIIIRDGREYVQDKIFDGQVPITYPRHSLEEYFSDTFTQLFELIEEPTTIMKERADGPEPDQLGFIARKR
jgi:ubiquinone/menaquinone biosynthesis C-methylase UbiE